MKITVQDYRRSQEGAWMDKTGDDCFGLHLGKFEKRRPTFSNLCQSISKYHLHSRKIILSCYVALILQMKDSCSANLTFRAHNWQN